MPANALLAILASMLAAAVEAIAAIGDADLQLL